MIELRVRVGIPLLLPLAIAALALGMSGCSHSPRASSSASEGSSRDGGLTPCDALRSEASVTERVERLLARKGVVPRSPDDEAAFASLLRGLTATDPDSTTRHLLQSGSRPADFYLALSHAGLLGPGGGDAVKGQSGDLGAAISALEALKAQAPANAAYAFFLIAARDRAGQGPGAVDREIIEASHGNEFTSHTPMIAQRVHEKGFERAADFIAATHLVSAIRISEYLPVQKIVEQRIAANQPDFAGKVVSLGRLMMQNAQLQKGKPEFVFWMALEYEVGRRIAVAAWTRTHPRDKELPAELAAGYPEFTAGRADPARVRLDEQAYQALRDSPPGHCDSAAYDKVVADERRLYTDHPPEPLR